MNEKQENTMTIEQIGTLLRTDLVPRAIKIIQDECHDLTIIEKVGSDGIKKDLTTNGDMKAQAMYMQELKRLFPNYGIIAEENGVAIEGTDHDGDDIYFTVDPLDGTRAYERNSSQGVGTMIALCKNNNVITACVGDVNTGDIYGFAGEFSGEEVRGEVFHQRFGETKVLVPKADRPLSSQYVLLRSLPSKQSALINKMTLDKKDGGLFEGAEVGHGSIGVAFARLWKSEIGAIVLDFGFDTPWDLAPIIGISRRLGFKFYEIKDDRLGLTEYEPSPIKVTTKRQHGQLIIHESCTKELEEWMEKQ